MFLFSSLRLLFLWMPVVASLTSAAAWFATRTTASTRSSPFLATATRRVSTTPTYPHCLQQQSTSTSIRTTTPPIALYMSDDWSSFTALDDDADNEDELLYGKEMDRTQYAVENDSDETKAAVGSTLTAPVVDYPADPISVPAGSQLDLSEDTVLGVLAACREELGTLFGYTAENRGVGITGGVDYAYLDGPTVVLALKGRFWHERTTVLERVGNYLQQRIPEIVDVTVEDPWQLTDEANEVW